MDMSSQTNLGRSLLDTLERVRGTVCEPGRGKNQKLEQYFMAFAELEGRQPGQAHGFSGEMCD